MRLLILGNRLVRLDRRLLGSRSICTRGRAECN